MPWRPSVRSESVTQWRQSLAFGIEEEDLGNTGAGVGYINSVSVGPIPVASRLPTPDRPTDLPPVSEDAFAFCQSTPTSPSAITAGRAALIRRIEFKTSRFDSVIHFSEGPSQSPTTRTIIRKTSDRMSAGKSSSQTIFVFLGTLVWIAAFLTFAICCLVTILVGSRFVGSMYKSWGLAVGLSIGFEFMAWQPLVIILISFLETWSKIKEQERQRAATHVERYQADSARRFESALAQSGESFLKKAMIDNLASSDDSRSVTAAVESSAPAVELVEYEESD